MVRGVVGAHRVQCHIKGPVGLQRTDTVVAQYTTLGTQRLAGIQFFLAAQGYPAGIAEGLAQLDGGGAHTAGTRMNQDLFPGLGRAQLEYVQPGRTEDLRDGSGVFPAHAGGHRQQMPRINHYFISDAATGQQRADPVTDRPAHRAVDLDHFTGTLQPQDVAGARWCRVVSGPLQQVCAVDSCSPNSHTNLPWRQRHGGFRTPAQYPGFSLQSSHGAPIVISQIGLKKAPTGPCRALKNTLTSPDTIPLMTVSKLLRTSCVIALLGLGTHSFAAETVDSALPVFDRESLQPTREQMIASLNTVELLRRHHYNRIRLDDALSSEIFDTYLRQLDPQRSLFTGADIKSFEEYRHQLDDLLVAGDLSVGFAIHTRQIQRADERMVYAQQLLREGIDKLDFAS